MKYSEKIEFLENHASDCQIEADKYAIKLIEQTEIFAAISIVQSICDFNLAWLYQISPEVILHKESLIFISDNIKKFKRKIGIEEMMSLDFRVRDKGICYTT
jgi:hypothetical protein